MRAAPLALLLAIAGSLVIHGLALFGTDLDLSGPAEPIPLRAELRPAPVPAEAGSTPPRRAPVPRPPRQTPLPESQATAVSPAVPEPPGALSEPAPIPAVRETAAATPVQPRLPGEGVIRYTVIKTSLGLAVGRAEHRWQFAPDGRYQLQATIETTGLAALLRPSRIEQESRGRLGPAGLLPETYRVRKNGQDSNENADFDWSTAQATLSREGVPRPVSRGSQDLLSLHYQLAYLARLADGVRIGVITGKKYERYDLDSLGEELLDTPAGRFRTLHVRAQTDNVTEFWIALDQRGLPVKIRFTDHKGDSFEQIVTEIGLPPETAELQRPPG